MEDTYESGDSLYLAMRCWIARFVADLLGTIPSCFKHILSDFQVKQKSSKPNPRMVLWNKSPTIWFKLNVNSSCRGNQGPMKEVGLFDMKMESLRSFSWRNLKMGPIIGPSFKYLLVASVCKNMDIQNIIIEIDSALVVS